MIKAKILRIGMALAVASSLGAQRTLGEIADKTVVHGYLTVDYVTGKLVNDATSVNKIIPNFELQRFIIGTQSQLSDTIVFNSELEVEHATRVGVKTTKDAAGKVTSAGAGLEIELEQAWVEFRRFKAFQPRAGVVLIPIGRINQNHDSDKVDSVERPLVDGDVIPTTWFEPGIGFTGSVEWGDSAEIKYEAYVFNGLRGSAATAGSEKKIRDMRIHKDSSNDTNTDKALAARLAISPVQGLEVAASGYTGKYDPAGTLGMTLGALDAMFRWRWLDLQGEWAEVKIERPDPSSVAQRVNQDPLFINDPGYFDPLGTFAGLRGGWFAQALARVPVGEWGHLEPFAQISSQDLDKSEETMNDQLRSVVGLNYRPIDSLVVKLNYANTAYKAQYLDAAGKKNDVEDNRFLASLAASY